MKKVFALAVVLGLAACAPKEPAAPAADTTHMAAPAAMDTTKHDSTMTTTTTPAPASTTPAPKKP
jgi:hypothetical protein